METVLDKLMIVCAVASFAGGLFGQVAIGATYIRKVLRSRCPNHSHRLEKLEDWRHTVDERMAEK